ncbi:adenylate/guanylate cyclase domain-containing protein [Enterovirga aerilata]|uniref:Adenylate/guanylate cyclase domain-containing protein n=1 Tax=Enterovirga aerilata TaxID=2730920 RepID=A0A849I5K3_9HYPH|nr:adenylate/guanylate cyclase domain-containing protein [Enterovirga sp. DB1703]NNM71615.1 adenylate/guanylate cyclase domain-containing protein [Enterovirga sp. DB1703]
MFTTPVDPFTERTRLARSSRFPARGHDLPPPHRRRPISDPRGARRSDSGKAARVRAAILFVDLRGFTGTAERLGLERTHDMLRSYYRIIDRCAAASGGSVLGYQGDGAMLGWGVRRKDPHHAAGAVRGAIELLSALTAWLERHGAPASPVAVRIGAHCGEVIVDRLGRGSAAGRTAFGDVVNLASRLSEIAAAGGAPVAFSERLVREAGPDVVAAIADRLSAPLLTVVRGRSRSVLAQFFGTATEPLRRRPGPPDVEDGDGGRA